MFMSNLHSLAWHVEIKAAACDHEARAAPGKAFGFISAAYSELISPNQNSVVLEDSNCKEITRRDAARLGNSIPNSTGDEEDGSPG